MNSYVGLHQTRQSPTDKENEELRNRNATLQQTINVLSAQLKQLQAEYDVCITFTINLYQVLYM